MIHVLSFRDSVTFLKRRVFIFIISMEIMENYSTYVLKIIQQTFHRPFVGIRKFFLCVYNVWLETMDAFHYFPNLYCSLQSGCKRYPVSVFARVLHLWWRNFSGVIWAKDIFNCTVSNFWWYGLPKISDFSKSYGFMPRAIGVWTLKNVKIVCSTNTIFVVKFIKFRIFCFRKIVSQR